MKVPVVSILLIGAVVTTNVDAAATPERDARAIVSRCLQSQRAVDRVSMQGVTNIELVPLDDRPRRQRIEFWLRRDGDLFDISGRWLFLDKLQDTSHHLRSVIGKDLCTSYRYRFSEKRPPSAIVTKDRGRKFVEYTDALYYSLALDGYFTGSDGKRLPELLQDAPDLRVRGEDVVDGTSCTVVEGTTKYGRIVLWIAPSKGFTTQRVEYTKGPADFLSNAKTVSQQPRFANLYAGEALVRLSMILDGVKAEKLGDGFVVLAGRVTETRTLTKGLKLVNVFRYDRSSIDLHPKFAGTDAFVPDLPQGIVVTNLDDPNSGITYCLREGKVVPVYTELAGEVKGSWLGRLTTLRVVLAVTSVVVFALLASWVVWRRVAKAR